MRYRYRKGAGTLVGGSELIVTGLCIRDGMSDRVFASGMVVISWGRDLCVRGGTKRLLISQVGLLVIFGCFKAIF